MASLHRNYSCFCFHALFVSFVFAVFYVVPIAEALGTFGLDIHHRYSDTVMKFLGNDGLPEKDTVDYFKALIHRDHIKGRRLAGDPEVDTRIVFAGGNATVRLIELQLLQYAFVWVGTPPLRFFVALDTGSDLFWLPCECTDCPRNATLRSGEQLNFDIYSANTSSTETPVSCNSSICGASYQCLKELNVCAYEGNALSINASSAGILLEDVMQLSIENPPSLVESRITIGCGIVQTGEYLTTAAPNGVLGLGMGDISVPSILASQGLIANSFSMCYGPDGIGRIVFGDKGSSDQEETPLSSSASFPTYYNVNIEQVSVGSQVSDLVFTALFDSGATFTMLPDPVYTTLTKSFNSQVLDPRRNDPDFPLEFCYILRSNSSFPGSAQAPNISFTMKGGFQFQVRNPFIRFPFQDSSYLYCLAIIKTANISIIGQNFMTGYRVVFNREKKVLGYTKSDCYSNDQSDITPPPSATPPPPPKTPSPPRSTTRPNSTEELPLSPSDNRNNSSPVPGTRNAARLNSFTCKVVMAFLILFIHDLIFLY